MEINYKKFKLNLINNLKAVKSGLNNGTLPQKEAFTKYPQAMMLLGLGNTAYYRRATHNSKAPTAIYPIAVPAEGIGLNGDPKEDRMSVARISDEISGLLSQMDDLAGEDLYDMIAGNSDGMAGSTSSEWNSKHAYYSI